MHLSEILVEVKDEKKVLSVKMAFGYYLQHPWTKQTDKSIIPSQSVVYKTCLNVLFHSNKINVQLPFDIFHHNFNFYLKLS